ncbi:DUF1062 domain-containing protein [Rhizobium mesoamericanum]|uniref:DUF1062 domain-containing protein n=1 Tax=Rhizobium mesoamericanum STM3625 TaxID=1211777 RepID=K0PRT4_9HYPH|nr:DUF1062 domain-containing protein [Rhizobium mesoamericanum]CCM76538.1 hypothetical protein BN77_3557 [Rhizobium mesoamericanum STM3625]
MYPILQVRWTIILRMAPEPWIACSGCGGPKPFRSSGKLRLNANGKKLDAWLIYRCTSCGKTWNRPLVERQNLRDIDPGTLEALQTNDPGFIRFHAFDLQGLRLKASRIDQSTGIAVVKETIGTVQRALMLEIGLVVPGVASLRLDACERTAAVSIAAVSAARERQTYRQSGEKGRAAKSAAGRHADLP